MGVLLVFVIGVLNVALGFAVAIYFGHGPRLHDIDDFYGFLFREEKFEVGTMATDESLDLPTGDNDVSPDF